MSQLTDLIALFPNGTDNKTHYLDFENDNAWICIAANFSSQEIISATVESKDRKYYYSWPEDDNTSHYEDSIQLSVYEDFVEKSTAIWNGEEFDERVIIQFTFSEDEMAVLKAMAKMVGMEPVEYLEKLIMDVAEELDNDSC